MEYLPIVHEQESHLLPRGDQPEANSETGAIPYGLLKQRNPSYCKEYWARCKAFYKGGKSLLENEALMQRIFPKHNGESQTVYDLRKQVAHYVNYAGEITNHILSKLVADPIRVEAKPEPDQFYMDFQKDCSPPGGATKTLHQLVRDMFLTAMQCQTAWALIEMPSRSQVPARTLAEQEASGGLNAWCVEVQPESVVDWEKDDSGELLWALMMFKSFKRDSVFRTRGVCREEYWFYDRERFIKWTVEYDPMHPPKDTQVVVPEDIGPHTFGRVPLVCLHLPDGLWVMSKLESLAREHFLKRNALSWAELKALLPVLYEFLDPGIMPTLPGPGGDPQKAVKQTRSPAHVQQRQAAAGQGDKAEWIGPPAQGFEHSLMSCDSTRDEMHRVVHQMALAADNKGQLANRSGKSKEKDEAALSVVLEAYGEIGRETLLNILRMVELVRGDKTRDWSATGMSDFETTTTGGLIEEETMLDTVEIPSPSFKIKRKFAIVKKLLGDTVTEEELAEIKDEIKNYYSIEGEQLGAELTREEIRAQLENEDPYDEDQPAQARRTIRTSTFRD